MQARARKLHLTRGLSVAVKVFLALLVTLAFGAWDLPWLSQRQRGDKRFNAGKYAEAVEFYNRALEDEGNDWKVLYNLGTSYYQSGQWENAVEELSYAAQVAEEEGVEGADLARVYHNLGLAYLQLDDCENAVPALMKAAELDGESEDIARNAAFAESYCSEKPPQAPCEEGEEEEEGEGDKEDEKQGQADKGESNDESEAQDESECQQGNQPGGGQDSEKQDENQGQGESEREKEQTKQQGDQGEDEQAQGGQGEQDEQQEAEQEGEGGEQPEEEPGQEDEQDQAAGDREQESGSGGEEEQEAEGGGGESQAQGPREIPDDGLGLSNARIQEILEYMSRRESAEAPHYFRPGPQDGDWLDDESIYELFRRLFWGIPSERSTIEEPDDGIDW